MARIEKTYKSPSEMEGDASPTFGGTEVGGILVGDGATNSTAIASLLFRGDAPSSAPTMVRERHRVFVKSGVTIEVTEDILQQHFSNYGNVTDVYIPRVMPAQIPKGFAYISFDSEDAVHHAVKNCLPL